MPDEDNPPFPLLETVPATTGCQEISLTKFRNVFVFKTKAAMDSFINSGWQFGGQATAGSKTADSGGAMQGAASVYQWTTTYGCTSLRRKV